MTITDRARAFVEWTSAGYRPSPKPFAVLRVLFALQVLVLPRELLWVGEVPAQFFNPPPGPFALITNQPGVEVLLAVTILRGLIAVWMLVGWRTIYASIAMTLVLVIGSGLGYSFSKVDHFILYDLAPLAFGLAGWGAAWSLDAISGRRRSTRGYPLFLFGIVAAFALFTAAIPKLRGGWWNPGREATHFYLARDVFAGPVPGPLSDLLIGIDSGVFWKSLDYATLFAEGWLILAVFLPGLFRLGLIIISAFHMSVFLVLGIDFFNNIWAYAGFFCLPVTAWLPELPLVRRWNARRREARKRTGPVSRS
ncbi:hypothetical protein [Herbiconiux sp. VKM Ac-2851]|uniref:hypothetical protein n=1 Tax=Herbiconiux sp. VKM Ac-2851 TaxID=2739025 RepID=UPI0015648F7E|nr:hypothetical protein [Herbiconiux sp. VKM Ac-2851]NQX35599.1 hypothetical protein [Herbiconiux sp. VKM Ac-2851]